MSNVNVTLSPAGDDIVEGVRSFVEAELVSRHEELHELLADPPAVRSRWPLLSCGP